MRKLSFSDAADIHPPGQPMKVFVRERPTPPSEPRADLDLGPTTITMRTPRVNVRGEKESEETTFSLALLRQAQNGQTNRPQPIRRCFRVPLIEGHLVSLASPLFCTPGDGISQLKVLEQPLLVVARNQTLALRIQL